MSALDRLPRSARLAGSVLLRLLVAGGLALDAGVHADLAPLYDGVRSTVSEGDLFRVEAGVACVVALALLLTGRRLVAAIAVAVTVSALAALYVARYIHIGQIGPIPDMYEPSWYLQKTLAALGEIVALVASVGLLLWPRLPERNHR